MNVMTSDTPSGTLARSRWSSPAGAVQGVVTALVAVASPLVVCLAMVPLREREGAAPNGALVLVLLIVAVATLGPRWAGYLAAVSSGVLFDVLLTTPYGHLDIARGADIATVVLLLLVGAGVTELVHRGRRSAALAAREAEALAGLHAAAGVVAAGGSPSLLIDQVGERIAGVLALESVRFDYGTGLDRPRLRQDGEVVWRREVWDVDRRGLPTDTDVDLVIETGGRFFGRYVLHAGGRTCPDVARRRVAVALADQVGASLRDHELRRAP